MGFGKPVSEGSAGTRAAKILKQRKRGAEWNVWGNAKITAPFLGASLLVGVLAWGLHKLVGSSHVGSSTLSPDLLNQRHISVDWRPDRELRWHLACNDACVGKTTKQHEAVANLVKGFREATHGVIRNWTLFVEQTCAENCLADYRTGKIALVESDKGEVSLNPEVQEYISCATSCREALLAGVRSGTKSSDAAGQMLRKCGVVHVLLSPDSEGGTKLLQSLQQGYEKVRSGALGPGLGALVERASPPLRNGREEVWLPYDEPFTNFTDILSMGPIGDVVAQYFNDSAVVVDHVNIVNAPGQGLATRQDIHSDFKMVSEHLEVHLPLLSGGVVPLGMGPTRFCPCMHGLEASGNSAKRALRQRFGDNGTCLEFEELSWTLHADTDGVRSGPWVTLYDTDVHHQGLENISPKDRPVFVVALAASRASVQVRGYSEGRMISRAHQKAMAQFRGVDLAIKSRGAES